MSETLECCIYIKQSDEMKEYTQELVRRELAIPEGNPAQRNKKALWKQRLKWFLWICSVVLSATLFLLKTIEEWKN